MCASTFRGETGFARKSGGGSGAENRGKTSPNEFPRRGSKGCGRPKARRSCHVKTRGWRSDGTESRNLLRILHATQEGRFVELRTLQRGARDSADSRARTQQRNFRVGGGGGGAARIRPARGASKFAIHDAAAARAILHKPRRVFFLRRRREEICKRSRARDRVDIRLPMGIEVMWRSPCKSSFSFQQSSTSRERAGKVFQEPWRDVTLAACYGSASGLALDGNVF